MNQPKDKSSTPLRPLPKKSSWYARQTSPYQSKREAKNTFKGFLILLSFMLATIFLILWVAFTFGK